MNLEISNLIQIYLFFEMNYWIEFSPFSHGILIQIEMVFLKWIVEFTSHYFLMATRLKLKYFFSNELLNWSNFHHLQLVIWLKLKWFSSNELLNWVFTIFKWQTNSKWFFFSNALLNWIFTSSSLKVIKFKLNYYFSYELLAFYSLFLF